MAPRRADPLPRSLRRAAARPVPARGRRPSPRLQAAADAGVLTRSNTAPGSAGRKAVDRAVYQRRRGAEPDVSAREALGHRPRGARTRVASFFTSDPGPRAVTVEGLGVTLRDVRRGGEYLHAVRTLRYDLRRSAGNPTRAAAIKRDFGRTWRRRAPIQGLALLADADAVVALAADLDTAGWQPLFDSGRSRPGRRRRSARRAR